MQQYHYTSQCRSITGHTDAYEAQAKDMVIQGMIYFDNHPTDKAVLTQLSTAYEITTHLPMLFQSIMDAARLAPSHEMMVHIIAHVKFAVMNGWQLYITNMETFNKTDYAIKPENNG